VELDEAYARRHVSVTPGRYVMIAVSDTGKGMPPEVRERIFEPFFTTKEIGKGTGLGLSTVYGIVKQTGGNIWVYSEPGKGTSFKIYLPRVDDPLTKVGEKEESELFRGVGVILVVEDDKDVREVVLEVLRTQGYSILEALNEEEALLICQQYKDTIHLMLTDVVMPQISGFDLAKRLVVLHPEMKVLFMSGYADNAIIQHGVLKEGLNFIQKPFSINELARKVREVLEKDRKLAI
jgi:two-component system cell cycle sensor histidine kinase/response regulator CckA